MRSGLRCYERGLFTWPEWTEALTREIERAQVAGDPDRGDTYYHHWLAALEGIVASKGAAEAASLLRYRAAWEHAAHRTPHGTPITLLPGDFDRSDGGRGPG